VMREKSDVAPRLFRLFTNIDAFDLQFPLCVPYECRGNFEECRLARSVAAEERHEFATLYFQRHPTKCREVSEGLPDVFSFECVCAFHGRVRPESSPEPSQDETSAL